MIMIAASITIRRQFLNEFLRLRKSLGLANNWISFVGT
jgi:hypothetical protein